MRGTGATSGTGPLTDRGRGRRRRRTRREGVRRSVVPVGSPPAHRDVDRARPTVSVGCTSGTPTAPTRRPAEPGGGGVAGPPACR
ncbi:hypothetical protein Ae406Ps2_0653 [Pseudonocardia sp. Ae406_Ps2]|nr:hypothetical protein Ae406Ps2_0653 [Pseudonocardia sp. Ae406_Ps2]OLM07557.1 hypothetical protein Ae331Ps2_5267c [Pseudonocardia sp. Ae331_Ps2]OLM14744.1 hypothetical protein Ae505Ps2_4875c [Pseudonocardia sp. Ae505_Ps2]